MSDSNVPNGDSDKCGWLLLVYRVPSEPTRVRERDAFGAQGRQSAEAELSRCEEELERYAARVYAEEAESR